MIEPALLADALLECAQTLRRDRRACAADLAPTEVLVLRELSRHADAIAPIRVARAVGCTRAAIAKWIHRLASAGLVDLVRDPSSARCRALQLTAAGRDASARLIADDPATARFERLTPPQREQLALLLAQLRT